MQVKEIYIQAHNAGNSAVQAATITPMVVTQKANPLNDSSDTVKQWYVEDGICGFASVIVKPALKLTSLIAATMLFDGAVSSGHDNDSDVVEV